MAACVDCVPLCLVCQSTRATVLTSRVCGHGLCDECLDRTVEHQRSHRLHCPCGAPDAAIDPRLLSETAFDRWRRAPRTEDDDDARARLSERPLPAGLRDVAAHASDVARTCRCPHCHRRFVDFDGCLALQCTCGGFFCALCEAPCASNEEAHTHVQTGCPHNPEGPYFWPLAAVQRVWRERARARMSDWLDGVEARDGRHVRRRLEALVEPDLVASVVAHRPPWRLVVAALLGFAGSLALRSLTEEPMALGVHLTWGMAVGVLTSSSQGASRPDSW